MTQTKKEFTLTGVALSKSHPTKLTFDELYTWVIWQFPRSKQKGLCGAVHPPIPEHGWYPAIIFVKEKCVEVYAHHEMLYPTPESAAEHFNNGNPAND